MKKAFFVSLAVAICLSGCAGHTLRSSRSRPKSRRISSRKPASKPSPTPEALPTDGELMTVGVYEGTEPGEPQKLMLKDESGKRLSFICIEGCPVIDIDENPVGLTIRVFWRKENQQSILYGLEVL